MQHDRRRALARQALVAAEKAGFKVWQHLGAAYVARPVCGRLLAAPRHWRRLIISLSFEIAQLLDYDCGWGCTVERVPGGVCLVYRPQRWHSQPPQHSMPDAEHMDSVILPSAGAVCRLVPRRPAGEPKAPIRRPVTAGLQSDIVQGRPEEPTS